MESREIKIWKESWNMEVTEYVRSIDGSDLHDGHVAVLKDDLYTYISDASKDANGCRTRLDVSEYSIAELEELCEYYSKAVAIAIDEEERSHVLAVEEFEANIANVIECGAGDRETAIRWFRDANKDEWYGDESLRYKLGLPWDFDFDHGDRDFFKREALRREAA